MPNPNDTSIPALREEIDRLRVQVREQRESSAAAIAGSDDDLKREALMRERAMLQAQLSALSPAALPVNPLPEEVSLPVEPSLPTEIPATEPDPAPPAAPEAAASSTTKPSK